MIVLPCEQGATRKEPTQPSVQSFGGGTKGAHIEVGHLGYKVSQQLARVSLALLIWRGSYHFHIRRSEHPLAPRLQPPRYPHEMGNQRSIAPTKQVFARS